jgi:hypothetical protein
MPAGCVTSSARCPLRQVTLLGDLQALGAAAVFAIYLNIGAELRAWMPLFLYAVPVQALRCAALRLAPSHSLAVHHARVCAPRR